MNAREVLDALERSLEGQGYFVIREITLDRAGGRRADAVALQAYQSRGIHLHGFEVKVSRPDWNRELKSVVKADPLVERCRYWTVIAPQGLIDPFEVPDAWGLWEVRKADGKVLRTRNGPARDDPRPLDLGTVSLLLRRAYTAIHDPGVNALAHARNQGYQEGHAAGSRLAKDTDRLERAEKRLAELEAGIRVFQEVTGVDLWGVRSEWSARSLGQAFNLARRYPGALQMAQAELRRVSTSLMALSVEIEGMEQEAKAAQEPVSAEKAP